LPTAKQIIENQAVRDVKGEMIQMRGHILTSFQKMRNDLENIRTDVAKSNSRFKYAQAEFQDNLRREMASRDDQNIDILDHIRQWNPNQVVNPMDNQYSHKTLSKVPDFAIPQLNFEAVTNEIKQRLEALKNPHVFRNTAANKLQEYQSRTTTMIRPSEYFSAESLRNNAVMFNPQSKYLDEVMEEERMKVEKERSQQQKLSNYSNNNAGRVAEDSGARMKFNNNFAEDSSSRAGQSLLKQGDMKSQPKSPAPLSQNQEEEEEDDLEKALQSSQGLLDQNLDDELKPAGKGNNPKSIAKPMADSDVIEDIAGEPQGGQDNEDIIEDQAGEVMKENEEWPEDGGEEEMGVEEGMEEDQYEEEQEHEPEQVDGKVPQAPPQGKLVGKAEYLPPIKK